MSEKITMLYVDDEPVNLMLFEINFKNIYNVLKASSGLEGLQILSENPGISVVISDMKMPGMNGIEFIKKAHNDYPQIIFFILTGYDITNDIAEALEKKIIHEYFSKPFNVKEIEKSIALALNG